VAAELSADRPAWRRREFASLRQFYRVLAVVGVVGVVAFTWIHRAADPLVADPLWQRGVMAAACLGLFAASWWVSLRQLTSVAYVVYYLLTIWVLQLLVLNAFAEEYAFAVLVVTAGIAGTFQNRRHLLYYQLATLAGLAVGAELVTDHGVSLPVFFAYSVTLAVLVYVAVAARLDVDTRRVDSEARYAKAAERLVYEATHDLTTGLPNRTLLLDRLERLLASARRHREARFAVLLVNLDRFRRVTDSLGHAVGDRLLEQVSQRLRSALREEDTLARVGGDEFVAVIAMREEDEVLRVAERLNAALEPAVHVAGQAIHVGASMGITVGPGSYTDPGQMLRDADIAMYRSKQGRLNRPQFFDEAMHQQAVAQLRLEAELRGALLNHELELHYQPIICMATGRVDDFEALVRWRHPTQGLLLPARFLPLAEESGLIIDIGRWALAEACRAQARWLEDGACAAALGGRVPRVHVNLSGAHFATGTIIEDVAEALDGRSFTPRLGVEITESVLLADPEAAADVLRELRQRGVGVAIDDFGTGYSSLGYLHSLPADVLKIDRSFVARSPEHSGMEVIRSIIMLAGQLGLDTVAEGIESEEQARLLRLAGATHAQGFHYSAALPEADATRVLAAV
jgi:diguanylate cyclase (GGDEF)-like protein